MAGFRCPFCNEIMSINLMTKTFYKISFSCVNENQYNNPYIDLTIYRCPNDDCGRHSIHVIGKSDSDFDGLDTYIWPPYICEHYPDFVPMSIQQDYREACAIKDISPKASATLSRRCLQGMIRDFHDIVRNNLHQEIRALRGKVDDDILDALLALKSIGNIGAHPETDVNLMVDVEPEEAAELISFIELLIDDWYVARENRKGLLRRLKDIESQKRKDKQPQGLSSANN